MNSFRSAILTGKGLKGDPVVRAKKAHGADADNLSSVDVPRSETRTRNQRDDDRHRLAEESATARFDGEEHVIELINLSGGGAMIRADFAPRLWERVDLIFTEGSEIECAVRWIRGDRVGLEFAHETKIDCAPEKRDAVLLDVIRRSFSDVTISTTRPAAVPVSNEPTTDDDDAVTNSRRIERRHPLIWKGTLLYNHSSEKVRLRNISEHGALIESPVACRIGAEVYLDLNEAGQHFATVSWACGDKIGLRFENLFDLSLLGGTKPEIAPSLMTRAGPSGRTIDQDNPWADGWQRQSLDELREDLEGFMKR